MKKKKYYSFSWCVCSFDQECIIVASNKDSAIQIFTEKVVKGNGRSPEYIFLRTKKERKISTKKDNYRYTWAASYATVTNLNKIYNKHYLKNLVVDFEE